MMPKFTLQYCIVTSCVLLLSCTKPSPQLPSNKGNEGDKNELALVELNQKLVSKEDSILTQYVLEKDSSFKKDELGFWYRIDFHTKNKQIKLNDICTLKYKLMSLDMSVLKEEEKEITIGKKELVVGLEEGIKLLHRGEKATFIIPWNLGYGRNGLNTIVKPYTSIIYTVEIE